MKSIIWQKTGGKTHRVTIDEGSLVSPFYALANSTAYQQGLANMQAQYSSSAQLQQAFNQQAGGLNWEVASLLGGGLGL